LHHSSYAADIIALMAYHLYINSIDRGYDPAPAQCRAARALLSCREATDAFGVCRIEMTNFRADDLIATYVRLCRRGRRDGDDRLLRQGHDVACQPQVTTLNPIKNRLIGEAEVRERFGVGPDKVVEVEALCGDSIDNVPGVPGIGVKTAAELINTLRRS
jgi:DNA polymerase-1